VVAVLVAFVGAQFAFPPAPRPLLPVCPDPVVWNPLWSENPDGIGGRVGDRRRLTKEQRVAILEAQLQDPYRHPMFDDELRREIARAKKQK
jgi:hypothetical protein